MTITVNRPVEINVHAIKIDIPVRYDEEDIPNDFPLRTGDEWQALVEVDTGRIIDWPGSALGKSYVMHMKVVDGGTYTLYDDQGEMVAQLEGEYVPNQIVPGDCGDYVKLRIDATGRITNWPKDPCVDVFFQE